MSKDDQFATWPLGQALKVLHMLLAQCNASSEAGLIYLPSEPGSSDPTQKTCIYKDAADHCVHACLPTPLACHPIAASAPQHCIQDALLIKYLA